MSALNQTELTHVRQAQEAANGPDIAAVKHEDILQSSCDLVVLLDPGKVAPNPYATHLPSNWTGRRFKRFCDQVKASGGNLQPILVRPASGGKLGADYEIAYGHRRHRACLELGLPVRAIVSSELDDKAMLNKMVTENSGAREASPYERGLQFKRALKREVFSSARDMAEALGVNHSTISKLVKLANLPSGVTNAFSCPSLIRVNWGAGLDQAVQIDRVGALERALKAQLLGLAPAQVYEYIVGQVGQAIVQSTANVIRIHRAQEEVGTITVPTALNEDIIVTVARGAARLEEIEKAIRLLLVGSSTSASAAPEQRT